MFWIIAVALFSVALIPFDYRPDFALPIFGRSVQMDWIFFGVCGGIAAGISAAILLRKKECPNFVKTILFFFCALLISSSIAPAQLAASLKTSSGLILRGLSLCVAAYLWVRSSANERRMLIVFSVLGAVVALSAIWEIFSGHYFIFERFPPEGMTDFVGPREGVAVGQLGHPLVLGIFLVLLLPYSLVKEYFLPALLILLAAFLTYRRSTWALLLVVLALLFWGGPKLLKKQGFIIMPMIIVSLVIAVLTSPIHGKYLSRFQWDYIVHELKTGHRTASFVVAVQMFFDFPLTGVGIGNYPFFQGRYLSNDTYLQTPDNQFLRLLAEGGLFLFVPFAVGLTIILCRLFKHRDDPISWTYFVSLTVGTLAFFWTDVLLIPATQMAFLVILGLAAGHLDRTLIHRRVLATIDAKSPT